jgi:uncharacterized protein (TIRG00374 family)
MSIAEHRMNQDLTLINPVTSAQSAWKRAFWWIQVLVTCALVFALCQICRWDRMANVWSSGDPRLWLACVVLLNLNLLAGGLALLMLIRGEGKKFSWPRFLLDYAHVQSLSQLTPGQMGEAMLPYLRGGATVPPGTIAAGLLLQRIVAMLIVSISALSFAASWIKPVYFVAQIGVVVLGSIAITYLIGHSGARARFNAIVGRRYGPVLNGFYDSWVQMLQEKKLHRLLPHVLLMIFRFATMVVANYVVYLSFGISIPLPDLTGIIAVATLATVVPISLNGLGIIEAVMVLSLRQHGLSSEEVLSVCVMGRSLSMLTFLNWSLIFWMVGWSEYRSRQPAV